MNFSTLTKEYEDSKEVVFVKMKLEFINEKTHMDIKNEINSKNQIILIDLQMSGGEYHTYSNENIEYELRDFIKRNMHKLLNDFLPFRKR